MDELFDDIEDRHACLSDGEHLAMKDSTGVDSSAVSLSQVRSTAMPRLEMALLYPSRSRTDDYFIMDTCSLTIDATRLCNEV